MSENKRSLVNLTLSKMMCYIEKNEIPIGAKLPNETQLAKTLKVGRSTLREAVKILAFSNVLDVRQGSGTYVKKNSHLEVQGFSNDQVLEAREMLEIQAVEIIIEKGYRTDDMLELKEILFQRNTQLAQGQFSAYIDFDLDFHFKLIKMTYNPLLIKWYEEILPDLKVYLSDQVLKLEDYSDNTLLHNELYQAIVDLDVPTAKEKIKTNHKLI